MKRTFIIIALVLVLCTSVFADQRVSVVINPYSFQNVAKNEKRTVRNISSTYGLGGGLGYDLKMNNDNYRGMVIGFEVVANTYFLKDRRNFADILFLSKVGFTENIGKTFTLYENLKIGLGLQAHDHEASAVLETGPEAGVEFRLNEHFNFFAGYEWLLSFPRNDGLMYFHFLGTPKIGAGYTF